MKAYKKRSTGQTLVVVSYYDARPIEPLVNLLRQLLVVPSGANFDILVVVNSVSLASPQLPSDLADVPLLIRQNSGYNIGAWQHGWSEHPGYDTYLFLQDECVIQKPGWLIPFLVLSENPKIGLIGEAMFYYVNWKPIDRLWLDVRIRAEALRKQAGLPAGLNPTHVQMTVVGCHREVLETSGGFLSGDDKATAVAGEIVTSIRIRHLGYQNRQVAKRPYVYILHPQWEPYARQARTLTWSVKRLLRHLVIR